MVTWRFKEEIVPNPLDVPASLDIPAPVDIASNIKTGNFDVQSKPSIGIVTIGIQSYLTD